MQQTRGSRGLVHRISREEWKDTASYVIVNLKLPNAVLCCGTHDVKPRDSVLEHSPIAAIQATIINISYPPTVKFECPTAYPLMRVDRSHQESRAPSNPQITSASIELNHDGPSIYL